MIIKWVTYQRGLAEGRRWGVFHRIQCCEGSNPSNEERGSTFSTLQGAGVKRRSPMWGSTTARTQKPPPKKQTPCLQPKTDAFFRIHLPISTYFPPLLFLFHPFSSLSPPSASSWSSHSFLSFAASKRRELTVLTSSVAWTICSQVKKQNKNLIWCICSVKKTPHILLNPRRFEDASLQQGQRQIGYLWERRGKKPPAA